MVRSPLTTFTYTGWGWPGRNARPGMARVVRLAGLTVLTLGALSSAAVVQRCPHRAPWSA